MFESYKHVSTIDGVTRMMKHSETCTVLFKSERSPHFVTFSATPGDSLSILLTALNGMYSGDQLSIGIWPLGSPLDAITRWQGEADTREAHDWVAAVSR
jgi:hypothetical protein